MQGFDGCWSGAIVPRLKSYGRGFQSIICRALRYPLGRMSSAKPIRAELEVDKNRAKSLDFVYRHLQKVPARSSK